MKKTHLPSPLTWICNFMTSPQAGAPTSPVPTCEDALSIDPATLAPAPRQIVANLPYNIATRLLTGWLGDAVAYQRFTLMFQREVAVRLAAAPRNAPRRGTCTSSPSN